MITPNANHFINLDTQALYYFLAKLKEQDRNDSLRIKFCLALINMTYSLITCSSICLVIPGSTLSVLVLKFR